MSESPSIQRALISVSDKTGLRELAEALSKRGVEIFSTGGTRTYLQSQGFSVAEVSQYTGFPEMMGGRLKTLHPKVFGGILARRDHTEDLDAMRDHGIASFELVVVNLYPFRETIQRMGVTWEEAIEQIDIGGPSLIRAASKNHATVTVATHPDQYPEIIREIERSGSTSLAHRRKLAAACFAATAAYDLCIAEYFSGKDKEPSSPRQPVTFPKVISLPMELQSELRYGENPHQAAAVYRIPNVQSASLVGAKQLNGKELSYNNLLDLDSAMNIARSFIQPAAVVIKHNNPCGQPPRTSWYGRAARRWPEIR